jgi:2-dehydro-3-deoxyphosphogluconate aldolase/(4S)-4-hydroxy-2-oxoglutarate aldolase
MRKEELIDDLRETGVVAVIRTDNPRDLVAVARSLRQGGIKFIEITMTVPNALGIIRAAVTELKDLDVKIGAGTVLDAETARMAILAGAAFIVGPVYDKAMVDLCHVYSVVVMPAGLTPTEIVNAWKGGADVVKVFPAGSVGGADYIKSIKEPFPQIELMPTKGVNFETAAEFIKAGAIALGVGTAIVSNKLMEHQDFEAIAGNAEKMVRIVREARQKIRI